MTRRLSEDDKTVWNKVKQTATPLIQPRPLADLALPSKPRKIKKPKAPEVPTVTTPPLKPSKPTAPAMDNRNFERLKRGKLKPERRIDLHGMTAARAQSALTGFLLESHARDLRLVLVITGKGQTYRDEGFAVPQRSGVLRQSLPMWISKPPLREIVLELVEAHQRHGGGGAFYLYLRRRR